jgi:uncharacterized protein DUF5995
VGSSTGPSAPDPLVTPLQSVADVLQTVQSIETVCYSADALRWFNGLQLQVRQAVETRIASSGFTDAAWSAELDVQFARCISALSNRRYPTNHALAAGKSCLFGVIRMPSSASSSLSRAPAHSITTFLRRSSLVRSQILSTARGYALQRLHCAQHGVGQSDRVCQAHVTRPPAR